jgi:hypothetical protein
LGKTFYFFPFCLAPLPTKEDFMKTYGQCFLLLTVLLLATAAQAQTTNVPVRPYSAGEYTVRSMSQSSSAIRIDNADEPEKGTTLANVCRSASAADATTLVFQRLGDNYFLYQVWTAVTRAASSQ